MRQFSLEIFCVTILPKKARIEINNTIILYVVYERETWSLTLKGGTERELLRGKLVRRVLGPKRKEKNRTYLLIYLLTYSMVQIPS